MHSFRHNFAISALYRQPSESMKGFLSKRWSFWLALFSCIAFLVGNMVGQHGWQAFWKSVWGQEVEIVFTGTVSPLARIPDPARWAGDRRIHGFTDVPEELLIPLPTYVPFIGCGERAKHDRIILSVDYNGDYDSGGLGCGSHPAADILTPKGTPVSAMANGMVDKVEKRTWGFGNTVVIRHPNVPDPDFPERTTTLYSSYSHLGRIIVTEGSIVQKGQQIAVTGQTGFATTPHLHFQLDRENAPFHPYWPFTTTEATKARMSFVDAVNNALGQDRARQYTVNPLAYAQTYESSVQEAAPPVFVQEMKKELVVAVVTTTTIVTPEQRRAERIARRKAAPRPAPISVMTITAETAIPITEIVAVIPTEEISIAERLSPKKIWKLLRARMRARRAQRLRKRKSMLALHAESNLVEIPSTESLLKDPVVREEVAPSLEEPEDQDESVPVVSTAPTDIPMPRVMGEIVEMNILTDGVFARGWEQIVLFARDAQGNFVRDVEFAGEIRFQTTFGNADFAPSVLTAEQFDERGRAFVRMLPRGRKTIIPSITGAFSAVALPMVHAPTAHAVSAKA